MATQGKHKTHRAHGLRMVKPGRTLPQDVLQRAMHELPDGTRQMIAASVQAWPKQLSDHDFEDVLRSVVCTDQSLRHCTARQMSATLSQ